ncbi:MAG: ketoacyl-ACP synthase III [Mediterranea sp.]|jgi:3-oxoacyl-[acyl-carrier-protein] synthase-3|nr:ketoacyl-ACP synthase III [Mediterranea sp.]
MAFMEVKQVAIRGMAACVPRTIENNKEIYLQWGGYEQFLSTTGIECKRKANEDTSTSDLCVAAAERLIADLQWDKTEIDAVVFVSQTADYQLLPATSPMIQHRLGLSTTCYTLDISLGCSGWVYALSVLAALMQSGTLKKGLLLAGDCITKVCAPDDKSTYPLFGDAGTATALEYSEQVSSPLQFCLCSDGSGSDVIKVPNGGTLYLDGMSVFSFGISKAPEVINELIDRYGLDKDEVDYYTFHQANMFMNEKIRKKLKLPVEKVPYSIREYGNTSCASIPLTLVTACREPLQSRKLKHIACGFGVGLSWGAVAFETDGIVCSELIEI